MEQTPTFSMMKLVKMISQNICFCIPRLQQYTVSRLHSASTKTCFGFECHTISPLENSLFIYFSHTFPSAKNLSLSSNTPSSQLLN